MLLLKKDIFFCFQIVKMPPKGSKVLSEKKSRVFFSKKVQELVLLRVKDNYATLYHDMSMKNTPDNKKTAWQDIVDFTNELLEKEKPGCNKVQDIRKFHEIFRKNNYQFHVIFAFTIIMRRGTFSYT